MTCKPSSSSAVQWHRSKQCVSLVWTASKLQPVIACPSATVVDAAGMQHILEDTEVRGTVLKFANLSSELLAYGSLDGVVRIAQLGASCKICHVSTWVTAKVTQKNKSSRKKRKTINNSKLMVLQDGTLHAMLYQSGDWPMLSCLHDTALPASCMSGQTVCDANGHSCLGQLIVSARQLQHPLRTPGKLPYACMSSNQAVQPCAGLEAAPKSNQRS